MTRRTRRCALLSLALLLVLTLFMTGHSSEAAPRDGDGPGTGKLTIDKRAIPNEDGSYTVELEAYATGDTIVTEETKEIPTDIILVLDQSGSMDRPIGVPEFKQYVAMSNTSLYTWRHNGGARNLYYKLDDGEAYAPVTVTMSVDPQYVTEIPAEATNEYYYHILRRNRLYHRHEDGSYCRVTVSKIFGETLYTYDFRDGFSVTSMGKNSSPDFKHFAPLYLIRDRNIHYAYSYEDEGGENRLIGTAKGAHRYPLMTFYRRDTDGNQGPRRIDALTAALNDFTDTVAEKAKGKDGDLSTTEDNVNHRIAVVGFANGRKTTLFDDYDYENTEVFIGATPYKYGEAATAVYDEAFNDMDVAEGAASVYDSISALSAEGGTCVNHGMELANGILQANPIPPGERRNRVIIVFTDGIPGWRGFEAEIATAAIDEGNIAKYDDQTSIYTVGVFPGANAYSPGNQTSNDTAKANWFMHNLSSNNGIVQQPSYYLSAGDADSLTEIFREISSQIEVGGATTSLKEATVIKDVIGQSFELPDGATADDIALETYACVGEDADGYVWQRNTADGTETGPSDPMGAKATIVKINNDHKRETTISVTGFSYADHYVGTRTAPDDTVTYHGDKLVIRVTVQPRKGFLGGNAVYTNNRAGVFVNEEATVPLQIFDRPTVNVPLPDDLTLTAKNKHVFLLDDLDRGDLQRGAVAKVGDVTLNLHPDVANFGLEAWQTAYVRIKATYYDADQREIRDFKDLREDTAYTIKLDVSSRHPDDEATPGAANEPMSAVAGGDILVYKPELTFRDGTGYYGATEGDYSRCVVGGPVWKHGETLSSDVSMVHRKPTLHMVYTPESDKVVDGTIVTKADIPVDVGVVLSKTVMPEPSGDDDDEPSPEPYVIETSITDETVFHHEDCDPPCAWKALNPAPSGGSPAFLLHVNTCALTIEKTVDSPDGTPFVFDIWRKTDDIFEPYTKVTLSGTRAVTVTELPVGDYRVLEDGDWSWRYEATYDYPGTEAAVESVSLTPAQPADTVRVHNRLINEKWLNGFSDLVANVFGVRP